MDADEELYEWLHGFGRFFGGVADLRLRLPGIGGEACRAGCKAGILSHSASWDGARGATRPTAPSRRFGQDAIQGSFVLLRRDVQARAVHTLREGFGLKVGGDWADLLMSLPPR